MSSGAERSVSTGGPLGGFYAEFRVEGAAASQSVASTELKATFKPAYGDTSIEDAAALTSYKINSVEWEAIDSPLDANPGNGTSGSAVGLRIFPDDTEAGDTVDRSAVRVKATVTPAVEGISVSFEDFDIDDLTASEAPLDDESYEFDNLGYGWFQAWATTDASGVASAVYNVSYAPTDNYVVAASVHDYASSLSLLRNVDANSDGVGVFRYKGETRGLPIALAKKTPPLTTWRKLNVEVDSMGAPPADFRWQDHPDDLLRVDVPDPDINAFVAAFKPMDIEVITLGPDKGSRSDNPWHHDFDVGGTGVDEETYFRGPNGVRQSRTIESYVATYVCGTYEDNQAADNDLDPETALGGREVGDLSDGFALVALEVKRDEAKQHGYEQDAVKRTHALQYTTLHEVGHMFNVNHDTPFGHTPKIRDGVAVQKDVMWALERGDADEPLRATAPLSFNPFNREQIIKVMEDWKE